MINNGSQAWKILACIGARSTYNKRTRRINIEVRGDWRLCSWKTFRNAPRS